MDGATLPDKHHRDCPRCGLPNLHEPPSNKVNRKFNNNLTKTYKKTNLLVNAWMKGEIGDPPKDEKGSDILAPISYPSSKEKTLHLCCKSCWKTHSLDVDGYKCPTCTDRSCETCRTTCSFVCTFK